MDPVTAGSIAKGVKTIGSWAYKKYALNKRKNFDRTPYGESLKRLKERGLFPSSTRASAVNEVARTTAPAARIERTRMLGRLYSQGMGNSMAGTRALSDPGIRRNALIGTYAERLARMNAESKA